MQSLLFIRVVKETGLASIIAEGIVRRACIRAGVKDPERMVRLDLQKAIPSIEPMLALFLSPVEVSERMPRIIALSRTSSGPYTFNLADPALDD